jgi:hypothetical protein
MASGLDVKTTSIIEVGYFASLLVMRVMRIMRVVRVVRVVRVMRVFHFSPHFDSIFSSKYFILKALKRSFDPNVGTNWRPN